MGFNSMAERIARNRFMVLTPTLVALFVIQPFVDSNALLGNLVIDCVFLGIVLATLWAISRRRHIFYTAIVLAVLGFLGRWLDFGYVRNTATSLGTACDILFFTVTAAGIIGYVLRAEPVTADKIFAGICAYLFLGLIWSMVYELLERFQPGSFMNLADSADRFVQMTYYSFVTMTTLGYGDITPVSAPAKSFACLQAAMGQLYPAILIARLVGLHTAQTLSGRGDL